MLNIYVMWKRGKKSHNLHNKIMQNSKCKDKKEQEKSLKLNLTTLIMHNMDKKCKNKWIDT